MSIIRHLGKGYSNGNSLEATVPTNRTFYFSEGTTGAPLNDNVIWYVAGASTNDQYPYTYSATGEFTAELRFQNGYTISSSSDVALSNDFGDTQYEWTVTKSLNEAGDILTLTFTPDEDDFNGSPVTISIDENNTVVIDPTPVYAQYDPTNIGWTNSIPVLYKNGGAEFGQPISYNTLYGRHQTISESATYNSAAMRYYSEFDSNGLPTIGSYVKTGGGNFTTVGYDVPFGPNGGFVYNNPGASDYSNFTEDGATFNFKSVIRYELDDNGYTYVAEIIDQLELPEVSGSNLGGPITLKIDQSRMPGTNFRTSQSSGYLQANAIGDNSIEFYLDTNYLIAPDLQNAATIIHLSDDGGVTWDQYPVNSFVGQIVTIDGSFSKEYPRTAECKFTFEGDLILPNSLLGIPFYNSVSDLRSIAIGNSIKSINLLAYSIFDLEGDDSMEQFIGKNLQLIDSSGNAIERTYVYTSNELNDSNNDGIDEQIFSYISPSIVDFAPGQRRFKFLA